MEKFGFLKRLSLLFNQTSFEKYLSDFLSGGDSVSRFIADSDDAAMKFSAVFACFRVLAETFASVPIIEYRKLSNGDREQTDETGLYSLLHYKANSETSSYNWAECMMYQLNLGGNAVAVREKNYLQTITGLQQIEWERVKISRNPDTRKLEYKIDNRYILGRDEVLHVPGPSVNGITGMSILEYAGSAAAIGNSYNAFSKNFFKNGAIPSGVFEYPGKTLDDTAYSRLVESLKKEYAGLNNVGTPMLLEDGLKYNQLTMKLSDAEFLASKKFQIEDFCRFCRIPLHLVQSLDRATDNNIEHQSLEFVMYTMLPHFKRFEQCINTQLLPKWYVDNGYYFEYNINALIRGDMKSRYEAYQLGRYAGFLSVNDIRRLENLPKIQNGDIYLQPVNMMEAGKEPVQPSIGVDQVPQNIKNEIEMLLNK